MFVVLSPNECLQRGRQWTAMSMRLFVRWRAEHKKHNLTFSVKIFRLFILSVQSLRLEEMDNIHHVVHSSFIHGTVLCRSAFILKKKKKQRRNHEILWYIYWSFKKKTTPLLLSSRVADIFRLPSLLDDLVRLARPSVSCYRIVFNPANLFFFRLLAFDNPVPFAYNATTENVYMDIYFNAQNPWTF